MHRPLVSHLLERIMQQKHKKIWGLHYCASIDDIAVLPSLNLKMVLSKKLKPTYFDYIQLYITFTKDPEI